MPRIKVEIEPGITVDVNQTVYQDRRNAVQAGTGKSGVVYVNVTDNGSTSTGVTLELLSHFDRDAAPSEWVTVATVALGTGTGLSKVTVSGPADWLIWKISGGDSAKTITFSAVVYLDEE